jgi:hypothetical protein
VLARQFTAFVRRCGAGGKVAPDTALAGLDTWLADARTSGVRAVETFAAKLEQDGAAVRAALAMPWSNGQVEGQVTCLRLLKQQIYGRAGLNLLRHRILLPPDPCKVRENHFQQGSSHARVYWLKRWCRFSR